MKLEIRNFRCHENIDIELPDNSVSLLSGCSGQGKSTIFESIMFVLYDSVKKPFTFGHKKCSVALHYNGTKIYRQKGPNLLQVVSNETLENDLAQEWINNEFGSLEQFQCSCYIRQMEKHFLFTQSATQIMDFIQTMAFGKDEIGNWKEKLQLKKKSFDDQISNFDGRIHQQESSIKVDKDIESLSKDQSDSILNNHTQLLTDIQGVLSSLELKKLEKNKKLELYYNYQHKKKQLCAIKDELESLHPEDSNTLEEELGSIQAKLKAPTSTLKQELKSVEQELGRIKKLIGPNTKVDQKLPQLLNEKQLFDKLNTLLNGKSLSSFKEEFDQLKVKQAKTEQLKADLETSIKSIKWSSVSEFDCPSCSKHLFLFQERLVEQVEKPETTNIPIPTATEKDLGITIQQLDQLNTRLVEKESVLKEAEQLSMKWTPDLLKKIENYTKFIDLGKKRQELLQKTENDKSLDSDQALELENLKNSLQEKVRISHKHNVLSSQYEKEKEELANMIHISLDDLSELDRHVLKLEQELKEKNSQLDLFKRLKQYKNDTAALEKLYLERRRLQQKSDACLFLKSKTQEAESLYLGEVIELLNSEINSYMECIFDKTPMSLTFKTTKELKTRKETRPTFDIDIFYKNEQYDNISQLSGGESAKCGVAILLAFNKILGTRMILLDESLNALDSESKSKVIGVLKSTGKTCILISHDEIQGNFDHVISI